LLLACLLLLLAPLCATAQDPASASLIPASELTALEQELAQGMTGASAVDIRRACKSVARKAAALLEASPEAPNRYAALAILFNGQKRLLGLENTEENCAAILETSRRLMDAPDEYAEARFEAEMLLSERDLAAENATVAERIQVLEKRLARYRGTRAEPRSLMIAWFVANKLQAFDLVEKVRDRMAERCAGDREVIAFLRRQARSERVNAVFSGTYKMAGGGELKFPHDRLGHHCLTVFWSTTTAGYEDFLGNIKAQQQQFPGRFEVYSFNLDELPDAGQSILRKIGLDATAMHLPGGRSSSAYGAYAATDPVSRLANGQGRVYLHGQETQDDIGMWLDEERYLALFRYLYTGDFLVADTGNVDRVSKETLSTVQACFTPAPLYYRLTCQQALANYRKAEKLCAAAIKQHSAAPDLWRVRNRRMIALMGMWNLAREPKYLEAALKEAEAVLATELPPGGDVVARFCLAKDTLRRGDADPETLLTEFVEANGGDKAPPSALAAAAILALESNATTPFGRYREALLDLPEDDHPGLWPVLSFLRDRLHQHRLFWGNPGRWGYNRHHQRYKTRWLITAVAEPADTSQLFRAEFKTLGGAPYNFPRDSAGAFTVIVFAEPPADPAERSHFVKSVSAHTGRTNDKDVTLIVVFLTEDTNTVSALMKENKWTFQAAMMPDGLRNPLVLRLGILSADRVPNVVLLRPDGTIAWTMSGLTFPVHGSSVSSWIHPAIKTNIEKRGMDAAFAAIEKGEFKKALALFDRAESPVGVPDPWMADRLHGRALAAMGLQDWTAALDGIDAAIAQRLRDFEGNTCKCHGVAEMRLTKATILDKLGRANEAKAERFLVVGETRPHAEAATAIEKAGVPVGVFYDRMKRIRLGRWGEGK
jgi:tetratricopeptide (TPR) repeat protein